MKGIFVLGLVVLLFGCGDVTPYQSISSEKHGTLLVNRYTGATYRVADNQVLELPQRSLAAQKSESQAKSYELGSIPNTPVGFHLQTKYVDNKMYYIASIKPLPGETAKTSASWVDTVQRWREKFGTQFTARLHDADGFVIANVQIPFSDMTRTVDRNDSPLQFTKTGNVEIAAQTYNAIRNGSLGWVIGR